MTCTWCHQTVLYQNWGHQLEDMHRECRVRSVAGSVAHLEKRCGCFVPGSDEGDDLDLPKHVAAIRAFQLFCQLQDLCPGCGLELHYGPGQGEEIARSMIDKLGYCMQVKTLEGTWMVPRHFITLHGVKSSEMVMLGERYGFEKVA